MTPIGKSVSDSEADNADMNNGLAEVFKRPTLAPSSIVARAARRFLTETQLRKELKANRGPQHWMSQYNGVLLQRLELRALRIACDCAAR